MDDSPHHRSYLGALTRRGWWWSADGRVLIHPAHPDYRIWFDAGSRNLGFSERMTEAIVNVIDRG